MLLKKAAMFGLDARIALAIFGALSVISGAALYSAIQDSKAIALLTEMQEVGKAWEQYMLDTGQDLPKFGTSEFDKRTRQTIKLVSDSVSGWSGPYLGYSNVSGINATVVETNIGYTMGISSVSNLDWGYGHAEFNWNTTNIHCNDATIPCFSAVESASTDESKILPIFNTLDARIDNNDGTFKGSVRYYTWNHPTLGTIHVISYKYAAHKMPS